MANTITLNQAEAAAIFLYLRTYATVPNSGRDKLALLIDAAASDAKIKKQPVIAEIVITDY